MCYVFLCLDIDSSSDTTTETRTRTDTSTRLLTICCSTLRRLLSNDLPLLRLIHMQTYDPIIIPYLVQHLDVMQRCTEFVIDMAVDIRYERQIFMIYLVIYVAIRYPTAEMMRICHAVVERFQSIHGENNKSITDNNMTISSLSSSKHPTSAIHLCTLFPHVIRPLTLMAACFPPLADPVLSVLLHYRPLVGATFDVSNKMMDDSTASQEMELARVIDHHAYALMSTLLPNQ